MEDNKGNKITIDDIEYSIDVMTDEQKALVNVVDINIATGRQLNQQAVQINHQLACVLEVGRIKRSELKNLLESETNKGGKKDAKKSKK